MSVTNARLARSATLESASDSRRSRYIRLWQFVPRELGFLLLGVPIAVVGFSVTLPLFVLGIGTLVTFFIGLVVLAVALSVSRWFGTIELVRLEWAGRPAVARPDWQARQRNPGFFGWVRAVLGNGHRWLYLLHTTVINFVVSLITWIISVVWVATGLGGVSYWFWGRFLPSGTQGWRLSQSVLWLFGVPPESVDFASWDPIFYLAAGILMLATLPFVTRGLTLAHQGIAKGILGDFRSDALQRQVTSLNESRGAAIAAEGQSLRRLERDIHDGPQQRLVRMQMDLTAADRQADIDPGKTRALIGEALQQSRDALDELRALSRGFAPPILMDRGLIAALESAAARSIIPAHVVSELPMGSSIPLEIERNAYFVASEVLTNAVKHSGASAIDIRIELRGSRANGETRLKLTVTDNGHGGAAVCDGHGLAGLHERLRGIGGAFDVRSPAGGPTVVTALLPLTTALTPQ
ncbi:sensor histidine kinase [Paramicrobacterium chengjingii]|uniref:sensor histidine kinase n=1 Tax=Paramicrobacterium chengjingii TaxID=2769067 RepID=UPI0014201B0E|nr:sensor domain-containing protein [Microbacterium chengjingii]